MAVQPIKLVSEGHPGMVPDGRACWLLLLILRTTYSGTIVLLDFMEVVVAAVIVVARWRWSRGANLKIIRSCLGILGNNTRVGQQGLSMACTFFKIPAEFPT